MTRPPGIGIYTIIFTIFGFGLHGQSFIYDSLDPVIITASKKEIKQSSSNKEVTIIDHTTLEQFTGYTLAQVLNQVSGVHINGAQSNHSKDQSVYLRGAKNDYTVILLDGIPLLDPSGIGGAVDLRLLALDQVERIEILKGAQTSLYGSDAIAGVINIITRSSYDHPVHGNISLGLGSFGLQNGHTSWAFQRGKHTLGAQLGGSQSSGFSEALDTTSSKAFDHDGFKHVNAQFFYETDISAKWQVRPYYRYSQFSGEYDAGGYMDSPDEYKAWSHSIGLKSNLKYDKGSLTIQANHDQIHREFSSQFGDFMYQGSSTLLEAFAHYKPSVKYTFLAGIDVRHYSIVDKQAIPVNPNIDILSPYGSCLSSFGRLSIQTDLRYTHHPVNQKFTFSINPSFALIPERLKLRFSHGTGLKSPTLSQLYGQWGANPKLKPESGKTTESGLYFNAKHHTWSVSLVYFERSVRDLITYTTQYINIDRQHDYGFEFESTLKLNNNLNLTANYALVSGKLSTRSASRDTIYTDLLRRPKHRLQFKADYKPINRWLIFGSVIVNGYSSDLDFSAFPAIPVRLKSYTQANAGIQYIFPSYKHKLYLQLFNLLNVDYQEVYGYAGRPLSGQIGWTMNFDKGTKMIASAD